MIADRQTSPATQSILLIVVYFGVWPPWFPAYLASCRSNPTIDWLFLTDCAPPPDPPLNVRFVKSRRTEIESLAADRLSMKVVIPGNRKLCDIRPAYGVIFSDYISGYDFWGFCDIDVIWGSIRSFYTPEVLQNNDVISTRKNRLSGHFTLLRNREDINNIFRKNDRLKETMSCPDYCWFDENGFSDLLHSEMQVTGLRIAWDRFRVNYAWFFDDLPSILSWMDCYRWKNGRLYSISEDSREIMYLHFMNWKDTLKLCDVRHGESPSEFKINYCSILKPGGGISSSYVICSFLKTLPKFKYYLLGARRRVLKWTLTKDLRGLNH